MDYERPTLPFMTASFSLGLHQRDTTYLVLFEHEVHGQWTPVTIDMDDQPFMRAFCCQFLGFLSSVIATEPDVPQIAFGVNLDDQSTMNFFKTVAASHSLNHFSIF